MDVSLIKGLWTTGLSALLSTMLAAILLTADPSQAQSTDDRTAVLAANTEFYRAFRESDLRGMDAVWGQDGPIAVEHPSGWRAEGRPAVMQSWTQILQRPPQIFCDVEKLTFANARARVICMEQLNPGTDYALSVRMLNVFHQENGTWKMIYHGPVTDEAVS